MRYNNKKKILAIVASLSVIIAVLLTISIRLMPEIPSYSNTTNMTLAEKVGIENNMSTTPITRPVYDEGFFYVTPNYTSFYDKKGEMLWNEIFNLNNVAVAQNKDYLATAQYNVNSSTIYVFNTEGLMYKVQPNKKILKHTINSSGYLGLIFEEGAGYQIQVYDNIGTKILTYTFAEKNSIPVDVSVSDNNKYLAIPFFNYDGLNPVSKTIFLYLDKTDSTANTNGNATIAGFNLDSTIPFMSRFIGNDLYLVTDKKIAVYTVSKGTVVETLSVEVNNYIRDVDLIDDKYIIIAMSEKVNTMAEFEPNTVVIYDLQGNVVGQTQPIPALEYVTGSALGFLVQSNNTVTQYDFKCNPIFSCSFEQTISEAYVINKNLDTIVTTSKTVIYEVVRTSVGY